jgi:hypothetical protein
VAVERDARCLARTPETVFGGPKLRLPLHTSLRN